MMVSAMARQTVRTVLGVVLIYGVFRDASGKWRNGRRARFRSVCPKGRGGSTPPLPTLVETAEGPAVPVKTGIAGPLSCGTTACEVAVQRDRDLGWPNRSLKAEQSTSRARPDLQSGRSRGVRRVRQSARTAGAHEAAGGRVVAVGAVEEVSLGEVG
jgi:hypothetical protein